jgi:hypothetical protein
MQLVSYCCLWIVASFANVYGQVITTNVIRSISSGTSFGMCFAYCQQSINITTSLLVAAKQANFVQKPYPPVQRSFPFDSNQWNELVSLVDWPVFRSLSDTIGCPDCADGGAEWIEIVTNDENKRVTFDYGTTVATIDGLTQRLRAIRLDYIARL